MFGQGIAGILSNVLRGVSLLIWPISQDPDNAFKGVLAYSLLASVFMVVCGMLQFVLKKNEFALFHLWQYPGFEPDRMR